ncbi:MAG: tRNA (guanosine(46)-N7)-methyltransferase TrmB [Bacteroidia bacterium]
MARRKQFKKAQYESYSNCYHYENQTKNNWQELFGNANPITAEMGCGHGTFSLELARRYPERNFLGVDLKPTRMYRSAKLALEEGIPNLAFLQQDLKLLGESVGENEIDEIWITFPDPFPKNRQAKHRMVNPTFLVQYRSILKAGGKLHYKTDNRELFHYSLEVFVRESKLSLQELSFDLHATEHLPEDFKVLTEYEKKFLEMDIPINYVELAFEA